MNLTKEELIRGKRLFGAACAICHVGGGTRTNQSVGLGIEELSGAFPPRNTIDSLVDYINAPTTYDGLKDISEVHPSIIAADLWPKMRSMKQQDLYDISAYILYQNYVIPTLAAFGTHGRGQTPLGAAHWPVKAAKGHWIKNLPNGSVVLLAAAPLLGDDVILVKDVGRNVVQILLLHGTHLGPQVRRDDGRVHLRDVLEAVVGGRGVDVVDQRIDGVARRERAGELFDAQAHALIGAGTAANVAGTARDVEQALAADELLLGEVRGLALAVHRDGHVLDLRARGASREAHQQARRRGPGEEAGGRAEQGGLLGLLLDPDRGAARLRRHGPLRHGAARRPGHEGVEEPEREAESQRRRREARDRRARHLWPLLP